MGIKTSTFSGWQLSGKEAETFLKQRKLNQPNTNAKQTLSAGKQLMKEFKKNGKVILQPTRK